MNGFFFGGEDIKIVGKMGLGLWSISELSNVNHYPSRYAAIFTLVLRYRFCKCEKEKSAENLLGISHVVMVGFHQAFPQWIEW